MSWAVSKLSGGSQSSEGDKTYIIVSYKLDWLSSIINLSK